MQANTPNPNCKPCQRPSIATASLASPTFNHSVLPNSKPSPSLMSNDHAVAEPTQSVFRVPVAVTSSASHVATPMHQVAIYQVLPAATSTLPVRVAITAMLLVDAVASLTHTSPITNAVVRAAAHSFFSDVNVTASWAHYHSPLRFLAKASKANHGNFATNIGLEALTMFTIRPFRRKSRGAKASFTQRKPN